MEQEFRKKIEETVNDILSKADMEEITEFKVRVTASERLGLDFSDITNKILIRNFIESFLLSTVEQPSSKPDEDKVNKQIDVDGNCLICKLADMTNAVVHELGGRNHVSIREFIVENGKKLPSATTGVTMTSESWLALKNSFPAIDEAVTKMQSKLRCDSILSFEVSNSVVSLLLPRLSIIYRNVPVMSITEDK